MSDKMYAMLIAHDVEDFDAWKAKFDAHEDMRRSAGIVLHNLHRNGDKPNNVIGFFASPNLEGLQSFVGNPGLKEAMAEAGVVSVPEITFVQNRAMDLSPDADASAGAIIRHPVADFDKWKASFDAHDAVRKAGGVVGYSVNTTVDDGNLVIGFIQGRDLDGLRAFSAAPELKAAMEAAGVTGPPTITFTNRVEMKRY